MDIIISISDWNYKIEIKSLLIFIKDVKMNLDIVSLLLPLLPSPKELKQILQMVHQLQ